jgi:hypothetical protein
VLQELLQELIDRGALRARTKWKQVYPEFAQDPRYTGLLGRPGSNPLELFWDVADGLDVALDRKLSVVETALAAHNAAQPPVPAGAEEGEAPRGFSVGAETKMEEFMAVVKDDPEVKKMKSKDLEHVFMTVRCCSTNRAGFGVLSVIFCRCATMHSKSRTTKSAGSSVDRGTFKTTSATRSRRSPTSTFTAHTKMYNHALTALPNFL